MENETKKGLSLKALLIFAVIIGILAAIEIPQFLNAQVRSKIAHYKGAMRGEALALESYCLDFESYPPAADYNGKILKPDSNGFTFGITPKTLTTPVGYASKLEIDVFFEDEKIPDYKRLYHYATDGDFNIIFGFGPDKKRDINLKDIELVKQVQESPNWEPGEVLNSLT